MNVQRWKSSRREFISVAMIALAVLMLSDVIYQSWMHSRWNAWLGKHAAAAPTTQPAGSQPATAPAGPKPPGSDKPPKPVEIQASLRKRNPFGPPKPTGHGLALSGVMGNIALFRAGNETVGIEEGKSDRGVTVKSINGYEVTIEFQGKPQTLKLFEK